MGGTEDGLSVEGGISFECMRCLRNLSGTQRALKDFN